MGMNVKIKGGKAELETHTTADQSVVLRYYTCSSSINTTTAKHIHTF